MGHNIFSKDISYSQKEKFMRKFVVDETPKHAKCVCKSIK